MMSTKFLLLKSWGHPMRNTETVRWSKYLRRRMNEQFEKKKKREKSTVHSNNSILSAKHHCTELYYEVINQHAEASLTSVEPDWFMPAESMAAFICLHTSKLIMFGKIEDSRNISQRRRYIYLFINSTNKVIYTGLKWGETKHETWVYRLLHYKT